MSFLDLTRGVRGGREEAAQLDPLAAANALRNAQVQVQQCLGTAAWKQHLNDPVALESLSDRVALKADLNSRVALSASLNLNRCSKSLERTEA